jgi:release factor glutamine methyltransferase
VHDLDRDSIIRTLAAAGCVAAAEEADELLEVSRDHGDLRHMVTRRLTGEPLAWITGRTSFCGIQVFVDGGVYVPRWQSEPLARWAARVLPPTGRGVDLCTGTGALALVMRSYRPDALVVATEVDPGAARCARRNGVVVHLGSLDAPLPATWASRVDVMVGVLPYVPDWALHLLPRDVQRFEPRLALDGGPDGLALVRTVVRRSPRWVRPAGWLGLEVGGDQVDEVAALFESEGYRTVEVLEDADGDPRAVCGRLNARGSAVDRPPTPPPGQVPGANE